MVTWIVYQGRTKVYLSHTYIVTLTWLVSFIKVEGLSVPYIVDIFDTIDTNEDTFTNEAYFFGIADITRPYSLPKCYNHLVSFIKVEGLFVPYIDDIFDTIKSRTMV